SPTVPGPESAPWDGQSPFPVCVEARYCKPRSYISRTSRGMTSPDGVAGIPCAPALATTPSASTTAASRTSAPEPNASELVLAPSGPPPGIGGRCLRGSPPPPAGALNRPPSPLAGEGSGVRGSAPKAPPQPPGLTSAPERDASKV